MTTPTEAPREALPEPLKVVAWITTRTTDGKKMLEEPCITTNPAYVRVHREWDWRPYGVDHDQAQSALESERQAHAAEVERLRADAERWSAEDREIMAAVVRELGEGDDGNAPGHAHGLPGIWDWDNGERAGKACSWCLCWARFTKLVAIDQAIARGAK